MKRIYTNFFSVRVSANNETLATFTLPGKGGAYPYVGGSWIDFKWIKDTLFKFDNRFGNKFVLFVLEYDAESEFIKKEIKELREILNKFK